MTKWKLSIPPLENLSLWVRILIGIITILIVLLLLQFVVAEAEEKLPWSEKYEPRFIELDRAAIDEAYKKHIMRLYDLWVTDYDPKAGEPPRAVRGAINARGAYTKAMDAIERRERDPRNPRH